MNHELISKVRHTLVEGFKSLGVTDIVDLSGLDYGVVRIQNHTFYTLECPKDAAMLEGNAVKAALSDRLLIIDGEHCSLNKKLRQGEYNFCDTVGNFHFNIGGIIIENQIGSCEPDADTSPSANLMTQKALLVLLCLLSDPSAINMPMRDIADRAGVSLGSVQRVIEALKQLQFMFTTPSGRKLKHRKALIDVWVRGYNMVLRPKFRLGAAEFRPTNKRDWQHLELPEGVCWGGEPAANLIDGYLIPGDYSVYTNMDYRTTCRECGFIPIPSGDITIFKTFWNTASTHAATAPILVVFAELMGTGNGRCIDAAKRLIDYENLID